MRNYANAKDVLPEDLFNEVKKYCSGLIYVPSETYHRDKRKLVIALYAQETDVKQIASIAGLSKRRVMQVLAEERDKMRF